MNVNDPIQAPYVAANRPLSRRRFLKGLGVALTLPMLESMKPVFATASESTALHPAMAKPRRMFAICNNLGVLPAEFFPRDTGAEYAVSPEIKGALKSVAGVMAVEDLY